MLQCSICRRCFLACRCPGGAGVRAAVGADQGAGGDGAGATGEAEPRQVVQDRYMYDFLKCWKPQL